MKLQSLESNSTVERWNGCKDEPTSWIEDNGEEEKKDDIQICYPEIA